MFDLSISFASRLSIVAGYGRKRNRLNRATASGWGAAMRAPTWDALVIALDTKGLMP